MQLTVSRHVMVLIYERLIALAGVVAGAVTSNTSPAEKNSLLTRFSNGEVSVLLNCGILAEGTDLLRTDSIFLCRPTRTKSLLAQMIGRGLRKHIDKDYCAVADFRGMDRVSWNQYPELGGLKDQYILIDSIKGSELNKKPGHNTKSRKLSSKFTLDQDKIASVYNDFSNQVQRLPDLKYISDGSHESKTLFEYATPIQDFTQ
ncbi:hypothetical protein WICPIJ_008663 [Wickerhamomyces pijperi]|uniref:Helicase C-terminal domain-containing protein n=1 Tax=Wickerhamomyces pijperi TaxID=599730 RepID=A0A9P8PXA4_WICPI|nr:hypothetical protein WICPIJ_008663 [Wickerhamomyces pijperi]